MTLTRRTELGVQPSVFPPHFLKLILSEAIHGEEMRIPKEFIRRFGSELSTVATITLPDGLVWRMGLKEYDDDVWFGEGCPDFAKHYSLGFGSLLWFDYKGYSEFHVFICDVSSAEIYYPSTADLENQHSEGPGKRFRQDNEDEHEVIDVDNLDLPSQRKSKNCGTQSRRSGNRFSRIKSRLDQRGYERRSKRPRQENEVEVEAEVVDVDSLNVWAISRNRRSKTRSRRMSNSSSRTERLKERAIKAAQKFKPKNPHFTAVMQPFNMYNTSVYVPAWVAKEYLRGVVSLNLQSGNGTWKAVCISHSSKSSALRIGRGWRAFARDNHLHEGDACILELIKRKRPYFKLRYFMLLTAFEEALINYILKG